MNLCCKHIIIIILILFGVGCNNRENEDNISNSLIVGNWAFLAQDSTYGEVYINDSIITFYTERSGHEGSSRYQIKDDTLSFFNTKCKISIPDCHVIVLENPEVMLTLEKINLSGIRDSNQMNPFYLRSCNFLVHKSIIKMEDAIEYLSSMEVVDNIVEEEFTPVKRSIGSR